MKVFSNHIPLSRQDYLTNGKHYDFTPEDDDDCTGIILDDLGCECFILTERHNGANCCFLDQKYKWEFVEE